MSLRVLLAGTIACSAMFAAISFVFTSPAVAAASPGDATCGPSSAPVAVHYVATVGADHFGRISEVDLSGFDSGCEGDAAVLQLWGNSAGDPSVPISGDVSLATLDSMLDPCSQNPLDPPLTVQAGELDLRLCATGGPAGEVMIHDLTLLALTVNGQTVPVVRASTTNGQVRSSLDGGAGSLLAFTGSDLEQAAATAAASLLLGAILVFLAQRRARRRDCTTPIH